MQSTFIISKNAYLPALLAEVGVSIAVRVKALLVRNLENIGEC
jgi:hypothetical protein